MKIDNEFTVSVPIERAWEVLTDLAGIAPCLPGAKLTGVDGDVYTGKVKIKVGPVISEYAGTARFTEKDDVAHRAVIDAKGKDSRGAGNASATIEASLRADGARTVVTVNTDLTISGKIAQFGSGMIKDVSTKLLGQFVDNLENKLLAPAIEETTAATPGPGRQTPADPSAPAAPQPAVETPAPAPWLSMADAPTHRPDPGPDEEPEPLDLMSMAGGSVAKRAVPVVLAVLVVVALVRYLLARR
jgi:carbon monoxide dehydrogenase subunit G